MKHKGSSVSHDRNSVKPYTSSQEIDSPDSPPLLSLTDVFVPCPFGDLPEPFHVRRIDTLQIRRGPNSPVFRLGNACTEGIVYSGKDIGKSDEDTIGGRDDNSPVRA